jgi:hypothetical protein
MILSRPDRSSFIAFSFFRAFAIHSLRPAENRIAKTRNRYQFSPG